MNENTIPVTRPYLPNLNELLPYLEKIWENRILTNNGPYHQQLEKELAEYLGVKYISLFSNGTLALITALQVMRITGEVITTPFSFVATAHSLVWRDIKPVFVDIDPETLNLNPLKIEAAITPQTTAIMPVHCYGNPCDYQKIEQIASKYNLAVIYDAAHSFGVRDNNESILNFGDLSVLSFHATKVFNTFEGGAIVSRDLKTKQQIDNLKNFGFVDEVTVVAAGINAKMSEINAAVGLLQLKNIDEIINKRKNVYEYYVARLSKVKGIRCLPQFADKPNYAYFPIVVEDDCLLKRDELYDILKRNEIYARRYFYPLVSNFSMYRGLRSAQASNLPIASAIAEQIICLPIYPELSIDQQDRIISVIKSNA